MICRIPRSVTVFSFIVIFSVSVSAGTTSMSERIQSALKMLGQSSTGRVLLETSMKRWKLKNVAQLEKVIHWSELSKTDAVLVRYFEPDSGRERFDREVEVHIKTHQSFDDVVMDLAHELTHATAQAPWDPYDPELSAGKYIWIGLEAEGGEVDALMVECQVALELPRNRSERRERCNRYLSALGPGQDVHLDRKRVIEDFYRVGEWKDDLSHQLGDEAKAFPNLSHDKAVLYSSTGKTPYPVALYREFQALTEAACKNTRKRLKTLAMHEKESLHPLPLAEPLDQHLKKTTRFLEQRCDKVD